MKVGGLRRLYIPGPVSSLNSPMSTNIMQEKMKDVVKFGPDSLQPLLWHHFPLLAQRFERRVIIWFFVLFLIWTASISEGPYFSSWKAKSGSKQPSYVRRQLIVHTRSWWWVKACIGIYIYASSSGFPHLLQKGWWSKWFTIQYIDLEGPLILFGCRLWASMSCVEYKILLLDWFK